MGELGSIKQQIQVWVSEQQPQIAEDEEERVRQSVGLKDGSQRGTRAK